MVISYTFIQWTAKFAADYFAGTTANEAPHYIVGTDGFISQTVDEAYRAWTTGGADKNGNPIRVNGISGADIDHRAITIEVASDRTHPYAVNDKAMNAMIDLLVDICQRNPGIGQLHWQGDKSLVGKPEKQNMAAHRWFANKACPGDYLYNLYGKIAAEVNDRLTGRGDNDMILYRAIKDMPDWAKAATEKAVKNGYIKMDAKGEVGVWEVNLQTLVWMDRAGLLDKPAVNV